MSQPEIGTGLPRWESSTLVKCHSNSLSIATVFSEHLHVSTRPVENARDNNRVSGATTLNFLMSLFLKGALVFI
jgi:hypothetical protein